MIPILLFEYLRSQGLRNLLKVTRLADDGDGSNPGQADPKACPLKPAAELALWLSQVLFGILSAKLCAQHLSDVSVFMPLTPCDVSAIIIPLWELKEQKQVTRNPREHKRVC